MPITNNTPNRAYPLPHVGNKLNFDLPRILSAFGMIDTDVADLYDALADKAGFDSPAFTGTPTAPTAATGTESAQIATTAFVAAEVDLAITNLLAGAPGALDTLNELAAALGNDANFSATVTTALAARLIAANNLSDLPNKATARTSLELGALAVLGSVNNGNWSGTDLAVANGGTGASTAADARTNLGFGSGSYTPTLTGITNVSSSTQGKARWIRIGDEVFVSGQLNVTPTASGASTAIDIALPVASNLAANDDLSGPASATFAASTVAGRIQGNTTDDRARMTFSSANTTSHLFTYHFAYTVI